MKALKEEKLDLPLIPRDEDRGISPSAATVRRKRTGGKRPDLTRTEEERQKSHEAEIENERIVIKHHTLYLNSFTNFTCLVTCTNV